MLNTAELLMQPEGISDVRTYEAVVVSNKDPKKLGRIQARVLHLFDGIVDAHLPWAIPSWNHADGASDKSGTFDVPEVGSYVTLKFQMRDVLHPIYYGYHVTDNTALVEASHNYPNRKALRLSNGACLVVDKQTNELFITNPGSLKIYVVGDVELTVGGNVQEHIHGNVYRKVDGSINETAKDYILKCSNFSVDATSVAVKASGDCHVSGTTGKYVGTGSVIVDGGSLQLLPGSAGPAPAKSATQPTFTDWPSIRNAP